MIASGLVVFAVTPVLLSAGWRTHLSSDAELEPLKRLTELFFVTMRCRQSRKHGQNMDKTFASGARELGLSKPLVVGKSVLTTACHHVPTSCTTPPQNPVEVQVLLIRIADHSTGSPASEPTRKIRPGLRR
jgi:hypothetical protein